MRSITRRPSDIGSVPAALKSSSPPPERRSVIPRRIGSSSDGRKVNTEARRWRRASAVLLGLCRSDWLRGNNTEVTRPPQSAPPPGTGRDRMDAQRRPRRVPSVHGGGVKPGCDKSPGSAPLWAGGTRSEWHQKNRERKGGMLITVIESPAPNPPLAPDLIPNLSLPG